MVGPVNVEPCPEGNKCQRIDCPKHLMYWSERFAMADVEPCPEGDKCSHIDCPFKHLMSWSKRCAMAWAEAEAAIDVPAAV